jgi:hypothetical protein
MMVTTAGLAIMQRGWTKPHLRKAPVTDDGLMLWVAEYRLHAFVGMTPQEAYAGLMDAQDDDAPGGFVVIEESSSTPMTPLHWVMLVSCILFVTSAIVWGVS